MPAVFAYGSLIHPETINNLFPNCDWAEPAWLDGVSRYATYPAAWRNPGPHDGTGVMVATLDGGDGINGVLITGLSESAIDDYRERERGYTLETVAPSLVRFLHRSDLSPPDTIYVATPDYSRDDITPDIDPNVEYVSECLAAVSRWETPFDGLFAVSTNWSDPVPTPD